MIREDAEAQAVVGLRKVLVKEGGITAVFATVAFAIFFVWVAWEMMGTEMLWFALFFLAIPAVLILLALTKGTSILTGNRKTSALFSSATLSENGVAFQEEIEYEKGRVELEGYWTSNGRSRSYHVKRNFQSGERGRGTFVEFPREKFKITVLRDGTGRVEAPAVRILDEPYKDVLLVFLTSRGHVNGSGSLTLSRESDVATVTFGGDGKRLTGTVQVELSRARKVRIEVGSGKVWKRIAEGLNFDFSFSPLPDEETVVFAHYKTVSPLTLVKSLWEDSTVLGHGAFELKAVLDVPLARDVVEKAQFTVKLGEAGVKGKEEETGEEWGF